MSSVAALEQADQLKASEGMPFHVRKNWGSLYGLNITCFMRISGSCISGT